MLLLKGWKGFSEFDLKNIIEQAVETRGYYFKVSAPLLPKNKVIFDERLRELFYDCFWQLRAFNSDDIDKIAKDISRIYKDSYQLVCDGHTGEFVTDEFPGYSSLSRWPHNAIMQRILELYFNQDTPPHYYFVLCLMLINETYRLSGDESVIAAMDAISAYNAGIIPSVLKINLTERAENAARARHSKQRTMVDFTIKLANALRSGGAKKSYRKIAKEIEYTVVEQAKIIGYPLSTDRQFQTIYEWVLKSKTKKRG